MTLKPLIQVMIAFMLCLKCCECKQIVSDRLICQSVVFTVIKSCCGVHGQFETDLVSMRILSCKTIDTLVYIHICLLLTPCVACIVVQKNKMKSLLTKLIFVTAPIHQQV